MEEIKKNPLSMQVSMEDFMPASGEDKESLVIMRESVGFWKDGIRRLRKNKIAMSAFFLVLLIMIFCFIVPAFYPYKYEQQMKGSERLAPMQYSKVEQAEMAKGEKIFPHLLGTDQNGRDYMIRVLVGGRVSMTVGLVASVLILMIGSVFGAIAGYFGGIIDMIMMRIVDIGKAIHASCFYLDAETGLQHDFHVYRLCLTLLGRHGQNRSFSNHDFKAK